MQSTFQFLCTVKQNMALFWRKKMCLYITYEYVVIFLFGCYGSNDYCFPLFVFVFVFTFWSVNQSVCLCLHWRSTARFVSWYIFNGKVNSNSAWMGKEHLMILLQLVEFSHAQISSARSGNQLGTIYEYEQKRVNKKKKMHLQTKNIYFVHIFRIFTTIVFFIPCSFVLTLYTHAHVFVCVFWTSVFDLLK